MKRIFSFFKGMVKKEDLKLISIDEIIYVYKAYVLRPKRKRMPANATTATMDTEGQVVVDPLTAAEIKERALAWFEKVKARNDENMRKM